VVLSGQRPADREAEVVVVPDCGRRARRSATLAWVSAQPMGRPNARRLSGWLGLTAPAREHHPASTTHSGQPRRPVGRQRTTRPT
jgi:hypothetical protein